VRDLVITENVSLDGVMAPMDGWFDPAAAADEGLRAAGVEHREAADALVLGRVTYEEFAGYWPGRADEAGIGGYLDQVAKYVVSASLRHADWVKACRVPAERRS
jgi:dihydrofolate reductase